MPGLIIFAPEHWRGAHLARLWWVLAACAALALLLGPQPRHCLGQSGEPEASSPAHGFQVTLLADGQPRQLQAHGLTVGQLLSQAGISLGPLDRVEPKPASTLYQGAVVRVTRVSKTLEVRPVPLPERTIVLADPHSPAGATKLLQTGRPGLRQEWVRVWRKDGVVTKEDLLKARTVRRPADHILVRGSHGLASRSLGYARDRSYLERSPMTMVATGYDPGPRSCGRSADGVTALGLRAGKGVVAVDPRVIALGSRLYIPGYGLAIAGDVGRAIKGPRIDLGFATHRQARQFGRRRVKVYLLD